MYVHVSTSAPTLEALLARLDGSASPIAMLAVGGGDPSLSDMHAEDGRARPVSIREYGSLDLSTHIFAITSPPGGVHIFACLGSFRNFAPKVCIFSLPTPVCPQPHIDIDTRLYLGARGARTEE